MEEQSLGQWLEQRCRQEHLSLRQAAARTGLTHTTIAGIINGGRPFPESIRKLAKGFGGDGKRGLALEDRLFVLAGYRRERTKEAYLRTLPLLLPEHQCIIQLLVRELAKLEGIEAPR
ncbi:hypothetical protein ES703_114345 [subsurface metagenome]